MRAVMMGTRQRVTTNDDSCDDGDDDDDARAREWDEETRECRLAETSGARERERDAREERDEKRDDVVGARESSSR